MKHIWTVVCRTSITDISTRNLSMITIVDEITFNPGNNPNAIPAELDVVTLWWRSDITKAERGHGRLLFQMPNDQTVQLSEYDIDLQTHPRSRRINKISGLPYGGTGMYTFQVECRNANSETWEVVASVPVVVTNNPDLPVYPG